MGSNKTASTTFQTLCSNCQKTLLDNGLLFPQYLTWSQHSFAAWMSQKRDMKNLSTFLNFIFTETKENNCQTTLISGEDFENFLVDTHLANEFEMLAKSEGYKDIEWVFIQRDPFDYLLSIYKEMSAYKAVLDLELMSNIILQYGFISVGAEVYNWKFVFDSKKFASIFRKNVNLNLKVLSFEDFISDFVGKTVLKTYINSKSLEVVNDEAERIGIENIGYPKETVEFLYLSNFLGIDAETEFYENNKNLIDSLVSHRLKRNEVLIKEIQIKFKEQFG
tara:strand:+ start:427 stop:1260 length:834 start_codon:yes stop_codon:yes gene_type:complete